MSGEQAVRGRRRGGGAEARREKRRGTTVALPYIRRRVVV